MALANNGLDLQNNLLQTTLKNLWQNRDPGVDGQGDRQHQPQPHPRATVPNMENSDQNSMTLNLHLHIDSATASQFSHLGRARSPLQTRRAPNLRRSQAQDFSRDTPGQNPEFPFPETDNGPQELSREEIRGTDFDEEERWVSKSQRVPGDCAKTRVNSAERDEFRHASHFDYGRARRGIMSMANSPLSASLLSALSEK